MADSNDFLELRLCELADRASKMDLTDPATATAINNVVAFSKIHRPDPTPEPEPVPAVPTTRWGKIRHELACVLDNETTRSVIKAGGAAASVALVVWSTVHRDHVLERNALNQANQRF